MLSVREPLSIYKKFSGGNLVINSTIKEKVTLPAQIKYEEIYSKWNPRVISDLGLEEKIEN